LADIFNDPVASYKNFKMGTEIDIAGIFIYDGMKELEKIVGFAYEGEVFSFLYHIAVGIERLQKVLIVMLEDISVDEITSFEESLHTHNHQQLHERITQKKAIRLNKKEISFLHLLDEFYINCRYDRFQLKGRYGAEKIALCKFIESHIDPNDLERHFMTKDIMNTPKVKEFFGRIIGVIAKRYYSEICEQAYKQNLYTYELRYGSPAQKIFLPDFKKNSLQEQTINEQIALKELIVYLMNTQDQNSFIRFIKDIVPLDFDVALVNEYIEELCKGHITQDLVDQVESIYEDMQSVKNRLELIHLIGNPNVNFDYAEIWDCYDMMKSLVVGEYDCIEFARNFPEKFSYIDDDEIYEVLKVIPELIERLIRKQKLSEEDKNQFIETIAEITGKFKEFCGFEN